MLPGFRFLFAAVILSMSILIFGLGAAALLRATHEEFAHLPLRRPPPEPMFTRQNDPVMPTLALLRVEPPAVDEKVDNMPAAVAPEIAADIPAPAEQAPDASPAEPEKLTALTPEVPLPAEAATPEIRAADAMTATPVAETITAAPAAPAETEAPVAAAEARLAAIAETPEPPAANVPPPAEPAMDVLSLEGNVAATRIATLGGPAVAVVEKTPAKTTVAKPDRTAVRKRVSQRARERRQVQVARRARLAREAAALAAQQQQQANPFAQLLVARPAR